MSSTRRRRPQKRDTDDANHVSKVSNTSNASNVNTAIKRALDDYRPDNTLMLMARYALSALMHVAVVGYVIRMMWIGGVLDIARSYWDVKFGKPCGAVPVEEYVVFSRNIVDGRSMVGGAFHVRGGMIGGTYLGKGYRGSELNHTRVLSVLAPHNPDITVLDFGDSIVGPGVIDIHVHMNEPAGTRVGWETMEGATAAAAKGGVTMVVDMPLNSDPVTVSARDVKEKLRTARKQHVQVGVWGGLVPENAHRSRELRSMIRAGAMGFKAFMIDSGIDAFGSVSVDDLRAALPVIRDLDVPLLVHAEVDDGAVGRSKASNELSKKSTLYESWLSSRPAEMEIRAVELLVELLKEMPQSTKSRPNFRVHVVHASSAQTVDLVNRHRDLPITVETCPHYLLFSSEDIPDGATEYKCAPAIRDRRNNDALVAAVLDGRIHGVSSDHSPSPPSLKTGDFLKSWGGISGIQYTLPALWESLVTRVPPEANPPQNADVADVADVADDKVADKAVAVHRALSTFPARLLGMHHLKGRIADGYHADFVVWDPRAVYDAPCSQTQTQTPYSSATMRGRVLATVVRGKFVYDVAHEDGDRDVFSCGNTAISSAWLRPHPQQT